MSIPFEETIPTPDKFKGWYAQTLIILIVWLMAMGIHFSTT